jgi:DNA topoisomerase-2
MLVCQFVPIVPTILLNGAEGIATGWSTSIPMYNPLQVIDSREVTRRDIEKTVRKMVVKAWQHRARGFRV